MKAVIIGAGRIGRGFVTSLLKRNSVDITFFDVSIDVVNQLNEFEKYKIHVLGNAEKDIKIDNYKAFLLSNQNELIKALEESSFVFTSVGGKNLKNVGICIAEAYHELYEVGKNPQNIFVTCENWLTPADDLKDAIVSTLTESEKKIFNSNNDVSQAVIRASGTAAPKDYDLKNPMDTWVQDYWIIPVDSDKIKVNNIPVWEFFDFTPSFGNMLYQKIYTNNTSVALIAYLGSLKGYTVLSDAANDDDIVKLLDQGYDEINKALISELNVSEESQKEFSRVAKEKYQDRTIIDDVRRIARDPIRKLSSTDRLIGPSKMALNAGFEPEALSKAIAAALYYSNNEDEISLKLQKMREKLGDMATLSKVSGLALDDPLMVLVKEAINELKTNNWIR